MLWAPTVKRLKNPERFTMMYAPITRKYTHAFADRHLEVKGELGMYDRNKNILPKSLSGNLEALLGWQETFHGDSFIFDYHLMWDHMLDPGYMRCAEVLHRDMATLDGLRLNGMVSCQVQRAAFPTGLPEYAMAAALWDKRSDFESVCRDYFTTAFGDDGTKVREYLTHVTELFDPAFMRNDHAEAIATAAERAGKIKALVKEFKTSIVPEKSANYRYLYLHAGLAERYADLIAAWANEDEEEKIKTADELERYCNSIEPECRDVFDAPNFNGVFRRWIPRAFGKHTKPYDAY